MRSAAYVWLPMEASRGQQCGSLSDRDPCLCFTRTGWITLETIDLSESSASERFLLKNRRVFAPDQGWPGERLQPGNFGRRLVTG